MIMANHKKILIVGSGITGATLAERFSSLGKEVLVVEKRNHTGGNCHDYTDKNGILLQKYGPHIFHTPEKEVWDYLSLFTDWIYYCHRVLGFIDGKFVPVPFNLDTLYDLLSPRLAGCLEEKLISKFGYDKKVLILELKKTKDKELKFLADFIYEKIFLHYTEKQWGIKPEEIDPSVMARVPVVISRDDRYYSDKYQGIPNKGYTKIFEQMLDKENIKVLLNKDFWQVKDKLGKYDLIFYTGPLDEFFDYKFGKLEYRCLKIDFKTLEKESFQPTSVVNYPNDYDFTRITEFKKFRQEQTKKTVIGIEYPVDKAVPAWPLLSKKSKEIRQRYLREAEKLKKKNIYFVGRLAEFKYYDMDDAVKNALDLCKQLTIN